MAKKHNIPVSIKLTVSLVIATTIVLVLEAGAYYITEINSINKNTQLLAEVSHKRLSVSLKNSIYENDYESVVDQIKAELYYPNVVGVVVTLPARKKPFVALFKENSTIKQIEDLKLLEKYYSKSGKIFYEANNQQEEIATLNIYVDKGVVADQLWQRIEITAFSVELLFLLIIFVTWYFVKRTIIAPIKKLSSLVDRYKEVRTNRDKTPEKLNQIIEELEHLQIKSCDINNLINSFKRVIVEQHEDEEIFSKLVTAIPDIVVNMDSTGKVLFVNEAGSSLIPEPDKTNEIGTGLFNLCDKYKPSSNPYEPQPPMEFEVQNPSEPKIYEVKRTVLNNINGDKLGYVCVLRDITSRKQTENDLRIAIEKAEELSKAKSSFFANMSHELRTPLNGILGYAEILSEEECSSSLSHIAGAIEKSGKRLLTTVNMILDVSRLESGKMAVYPTNFNLIKIVQESINYMSAEIERKHLNLNESWASEEYTIYTDEKAVYHIVSNVLNNAVKYSNKGTISIRIFDDSQGDNAIIEIEDEGIGIPEDKLDLIWEEFRQVSEGMSRSFEGVGLGLSLSKKFVERLNGTISCKSTLDVGSTFTITIPKQFVPAQ